MKSFFTDEEELDQSGGALTTSRFPDAQMDNAGPISDHKVQEILADQKWSMKMIKAFKFLREIEKRRDHKESQADQQNLDYKPVPFYSSHIKLVIKHCARTIKSIQQQSKTTTAQNENSASMGPVYITDGYAKFVEDFK